MRCYIQVQCYEGQYVTFYNYEMRDTGICISDALLTIIRVPTHKHQVDDKRTLLIQQTPTSSSCDAIAAK